MKESSLLSSLIDFIYPPLCLGCAEYTENDFHICPACVKKIQTYDQPLCLHCALPLVDNKCPNCSNQALPLYAYGHYLDPFKEIIIQFKFKGLTRVINYFSDCLAEKYQKELNALSDCVLIPIPLHPSHLARRGYNQAEIFAEALSKRLDLPMATDLLHRVRGKKQQARLTPADRVKNIKGVFELGEEPLEQKNIIIVDDVVTTGSTLKEAIKTLEREGYRVKAAIALAHAG